MNRAEHDMLTLGARPESEGGRSRALGRVLRMGAAPVAAVLVLARLGGVAYATDHSVGSAERLAVYASGGHPGDLELMSGPSAPVIGDTVLDNGHGSGGHDSGHGNDPHSENSSHSGNNAHSENKSQSNSSVSNSSHKDDAHVSPGHSERADDASSSVHANRHDDDNSTTQQATGHGAAAHASDADDQTGHDDNGLHLGELFHQGINDAQAQALLNALGSGSSVTVGDIKSMSLGELLQTAHGAGLSTQQLASLLDENANTVQSGGTHATDDDDQIGHDDNGLHLGELFHQGVNDAQAQALLDAMGGGNGLTVSDIESMSLGELLNTAHDAGLSTEQVADLLEAK